MLRRSSLQLSENNNNNNGEHTKEASALKDLRKQLADVSHQDSRLADDLYLLPWLKNFNFKIPRTAQAIRDAFKCRKENDLDSLADQDVDDELFGEIPYFLDSFTKDRMPAMFLSFKHLDKYENDRVMQLTLGVTKTFIKCFPCLLSAVYIVNSNKYFETIFKIIKPIVSLSLPSTKIEILEGNETKWKPILLQIIDEEAALYLHLKENGTQIVTTEDSAPARS